MNAFDQLKLWARYHRVTATLIALSIVVALLSNFGSNFQLLHFLFISEYRQGLPEFDPRRGCGCERSGGLAA